MREGLWRMVVSGVGDALMKSLGHMGWVLGWEEFSRYNRLKVGDSSTFSFWDNVWCGKQLICVISVHNFA
jgi:hypothetical protein